MEAFDIRPRHFTGEKLSFVAHIPGYVVCKKTSRMPFVMGEVKWLKLPVWEKNKKPSSKIDPKPETIETVKAALKSAKRARASALAVLTGLTQPTVDRALKCLSRKRAAYVYDYDKGPKGVERTKIWAFGRKPDAHYPARQSQEVRREKMKGYRAAYTARQAAKQKAQCPTYRDPLTAAFFGTCQVSTDSLAALPSRVFRQSMDVSEEMEVA